MRIDMEQAWGPASPLPWLLSPLAGLYGLGWWAYQGVYAAGLKRAAEPHRPVVVVGNLLVGGAGKTPTTLHVAEVVGRLGRGVVIGMSGYGSPRSRSASLAPDGPLDPREWGDEPAMVRWLAPQWPLIVGRNRVEAARIAHGLEGAPVLVMDDGYQHLRLKTHVRILLDVVGGNRFCLPAGPYREPRGTGLRRASLVLPSEGFQLFREPLRWLGPDGRDLAPPPPEVQVLCALARPHRLVHSLEASGHKVVAGRLLPDHDPLAAGNLFSGLDPAGPLVVTAKDWVKLRDRTDVGRWDVRIVDYRAVVEPGPAFEAWMRRALDDVDP